MSLKSQLSALKSSTIDVRGATVTVVELTAKQREELLPAFQKSPVSAMALVCAMCARDEAGDVFLTAEEAAELPPEVVDAIAGEALKLSGLGGDAPND